MTQFNEQAVAIAFLNETSQAVFPDYGPGPGPGWSGPSSDYVSSGGSSPSGADSDNILIPGDYDGSDYGGSPNSGGLTKTVLQIQ